MIQIYIKYMSCDTAHVVTELEIIVLLLTFVIIIQISAEINIYVMRKL